MQSIETQRHGADTMNQAAALQVIAIATRVQSIASMADSSALCLKDARALADRSAWKYATERALKAILYAVGVYGPAYREACAVLASHA